MSFPEAGRTLLVNDQSREFSSVPRANEAVRSHHPVAGLALLLRLPVVTPVENELSSTDINWTECSTTIVLLNMEKSGLLDRCRTASYSHLN